MLNASMLLYDATGRIRNANGAIYPPTDFNGGTPTVQGLLAVSSSAAQAYNNGLPYRDSGALSASGSAASSSAPGGIPLTVSGLVAYDTVSAIAYWHCGLPFTSTGRLCFATAEAPASFKGFSNGFSSGFN